jgi:predicted nuclease with TOPRIM domain
MSDEIRDYIVLGGHGTIIRDGVVTKLNDPEEYQKEILALLDAERAEHSKEVSNLQQQIHDVRKVETHYTLTLLEREWKARDDEISDLQQRNARLEDFAWACVAAGADIRKRIAELETQKCGCGLLDEPQTRLSGTMDTKDKP